MRKFEEDLDIYIRDQLASQPIHTYQELYETVTEVTCVKAEPWTKTQVTQRGSGMSGKLQVRV